MSDAPASAAPEVLLFTDGACSGNPGPGGWGCILRHVKTGAEKELSGGEGSTTNNQMELQAVISGLQALKRPTRVRVVTDSSYVQKGCTQWLAGWKKNGFRRKEGKSFKTAEERRILATARRVARTSPRHVRAGQRSRRTPGKRTLRRTGRR